MVKCEGRGRKEGGERRKGRQYPSLRTLNTKGGAPIDAQASTNRVNRPPTTGIKSGAEGGGGRSHFRRPPLPPREERAEAFPLFDEDEEGEGAGAGVVVDLAEYAGRR